MGGVSAMLPRRKGIGAPLVYRLAAIFSGKVEETLSASVAVFSRRRYNRCGTLIFRSRAWGGREYGGVERYFARGRARAPGGSAPDALRAQVATDRRDLSSR